MQTRPGGAFVHVKSEGFTSAGVERLNDNIRTYVWAILGAQAQTRSGILWSGTSFDAQKQFLTNVEDAISSPVDIPSAIERYQSVLQNASSKVDYTFGIGLYMAPSDMRLHVGTIRGYNNLIIIAPVGQPLGVSPDINSTPVPAPVETRETGLVVAPTHSVSDNNPTMAAPAPPSNPPEQAQEAQDHEDEKTTLVVRGVAIGLAALTLVSFLRRYEWSGSNAEQADDAHYQSPQMLGKPSGGLPQSAEEPGHNAPNDPRQGHSRLASQFGQDTAKSLERFFGPLSKTALVRWGWQWGHSASTWRATSQGQN